MRVARLRRTAGRTLSSGTTVGRSCPQNEGLNRDEEWRCGASYLGHARHPGTLKCATREFGRPWRLRIALLGRTQVVFLRRWRGKLFPVLAKRLVAQLLPRHRIDLLRPRVEHRFDFSQTLLQCDSC